MLLRAQGQEYRLTRNIQDEFQVPLSLSTGGSQPEPMAQYVYPRNLTSVESTDGNFFVPMHTADINSITNIVLGSNWYTSDPDIRSTEIWHSRLRIAYQARYQVTNNNNHDIRVQCLVFKVKRDVPNNTGGPANRALSNPLNSCGEYLWDANDTSATGVTATASNLGLHTECIKIQNLPPWYHWFKLKKSFTFTLGINETRSHYVRRTRTVNTVDLYPQTVTTQTTSLEQPIPISCFWKGDSFIIYKLFSAPADYNAADTDPTLQKLTTRTAPTIILSYQCNYLVSKPSVAMKRQFQPLGTVGMATSLTAADINIMQEDDIKEGTEKHAD